jgi:hypothetical protein
LKKETTPQEMQGLNLHRNEAESFQKKRQTIPQEMQGPSLHRSNVKLFQKRNNTPRNAELKKRYPKRSKGFALVKVKQSYFEKRHKHSIIRTKVTSQNATESYEINIR